MKKGKQAKKAPKKYPSLFKGKDNKKENWVIIDGQYKRCDYHNIYKFIMKGNDS